MDDAERREADRGVFEERGRRLYFQYLKRSHRRRKPGKTQSFLKPPSPSKINVQPIAALALVRIGKERRFALEAQVELRRERQVRPSIPEPAHADAHSRRNKIPEVPFPKQDCVSIESGGACDGYGRRTKALSKRHAAPRSAEISHADAHSRRNKIPEVPFPKQDCVSIESGGACDGYGRRTKALSKRHAAPRSEEHT